MNAPTSSSKGYAGMHDLVEDLVLPTGVPRPRRPFCVNFASCCAQSYYRYEFSPVAAMHSLITVGIVSFGPVSNRQCG